MDKNDGERNRNNQSGEVDKTDHLHRDPAPLITLQESSAVGSPTVGTTITTALENGDISRAAEMSSTAYKPVPTVDKTVPEPPPRQRTRSELEQEIVDTSCGIGSWRPQWMQVFASPMAFLINFALVGVIQGFTGTYLVGSMTTLEKRYAFDGRIGGFIYIADNLSQMIISPVVGYLGSRYNRPKMIAISELILAASCFLSAVPYFIYGPGTHLLHDEKVTKLARNETKYEFCPANLTDIDCSDGTHSTVWFAVFVLWIGSFTRGLGYTAYFTIGFPYLDDSVKKNNSPMYISILSALRLIGPAGGYMLSSFCLRFYENPFYNPGISRRDPRWIGAWWMGYVIISILLALAALPMFLFPKQFKNAQVTAKELEDNMKGKKAMKEAIIRLATNPILMFQLIGGTVRYIGLGGFYIFKTKYIESQYRQSSSGATFFTGTTTVLPMAIGIILGGIFITLFKPRPKYLVIYMFFVELCANIGVFMGIFLGCPPLNIGADTRFPDGSYSLNSDCNFNCNCTTRIFTPICDGPSSQTYFSPCFAGCSSVDRSGSVDTFAGCSCTSSNDVFSGYCPADSQNCNRMGTYLAVITAGSLISSTARTGNYLVYFRSIDPKDKSFAMGLMGTFMALFAFIPYPLIFGAITDSACLVWERSCGKRGNCWLYDQDKFRLYLHGSAFAFMMIGTLLDIGIIVMHKRIKNFYDEDDDGEIEKNTDKNKNDLAADNLPPIEMKTMIVDAFGKPNLSGSQEDVLFEK